MSAPPFLSYPRYIRWALIGAGQRPTVDLRKLSISFPTRKRLCYLLEGLRRVVEVRRPEELPAAREFTRRHRLPHAEVVVAGRGLVFVVARTQADVASALQLHGEWNELSRDPDEIANDLARLKLQIPRKAIDAYGHSPPHHLVHLGHHTQEVLDFQPCGLGESEVRREMARRLKALAKHGLL